MDSRVFQQQRSRVFHNRNHGFFGRHQFKHGDFDENGIFREFQYNEGSGFRLDGQWADDDMMEFEGADRVGYAGDGNPWFKVMNRKEKYKNVKPRVGKSDSHVWVDKNWTKVDDWSSTVYVTNIPPLITKKGLMDQCSKVGSVVDAFLPDRVSSLGKRFGFVRFVKGADISNLIYGIRNIWIGNFKLFADIARFKRGSVGKNGSGNIGLDKRLNKGDAKVPESDNNDFHKQPGVGVEDTGSNGVGNKPDETNGGGLKIIGNIPKVKPVVDARKNKPAVGTKKVDNDARKKDAGSRLKSATLQNDESSNGSFIGVISKDNFTPTDNFSSSMCLRVNNIHSMNNLHQLVFNEGFEDVAFRYLGGLWVRMDCRSNEERVKFSRCEGLKSVFHSCIKPRSNFVIKERVIWLEIRGLPLCAWNNAVFHQIASRWGENLFGEEDIEEPLSCGRVCVLTSKMDKIQEHVKVEVDGCIYDIFVVEIQSWSPKFDSGGGNDSDSEQEEDELDDSVDDNESGQEVVMENNVEDGSKVQCELDKHVEASDPCQMREYLNNFEEGKVYSVSLSVPPGFERIKKVSYGVDDEQYMTEDGSVEGGFVAENIGSGGPKTGCEHKDFGAKGESDGKDKGMSEMQPINSGSDHHRRPSIGVKINMNEKIEDHVVSKTKGKDGNSGAGSLGGKKGSKLKQNISLLEELNRYIDWGMTMGMDMEGTKSDLKKYIDRMSDSIVSQ